MAKASEKPRADLLAEIASLPATAFVTPAQAAAFLGTNPSVLHSWRSQRRGPRYHGSNEFIRYRICDLDSWMTTRANDIIEKPEFPAPPRLVWQRDQSADTADQQPDTT
jgi:hypothetical protein